MRRPGWVGRGSPALRRQLRPKKTPEPEGLTGAEAAVGDSNLKAIWEESIERLRRRCQHLAPSPEATAKRILEPQVGQEGAP